MAASTQIITRRDKSNGGESTVLRDHALVSLGGYYTDPAAVLDVATESHPASTDFALYWPAVPTPSVEQTAGEQIAQAMWLFNGGSIDQRQLAARIDTALKAYR